MVSELEQVKLTFDNFGMPLSLEWLESCIEWCKSENLPPNYELKSLQKMVYEQWLSLDLRDVEIASLPFDLGLKKKYTLTGAYYLQVMQAIDISKPKLWQLQRIRNNVAKNTEAETDFGKRVLQLTLTDGVQEIQAMEFKPVSCLSINIPPGAKLKITGPVMVRNGRVMLESDNVKNLGGSVDDLLVKNAAENVLARALGLEENPNPQTINERILEVPEANSTQIQTQNQNRTQNNQNQNRNNFFANQNTARNPQPNISRLTTNTVNANEIEVDEELLRELEEDFEDTSISMCPKGATNTLPTANRSKPEVAKSCSPDLFEEMDIDEDLLNEHLDQLKNIDSGISSTTARNICSAQTNNPKRDTGQNVKTKSCASANDKEMDIDEDLLNEHLDQLKNIDSDISSTTAKNICSAQTGKAKRDTGQDVKIKPSASANNDEVITLDDSFDDIDIDAHLDNIDQEIGSMPCSTQRIRDVKENITSPVLKCTTSTPKVNLLKNSGTKKMMQSKLNFKISGGGKSGARKIFDSDDEDDDFETPFSAFGKKTKFVPLELQNTTKNTHNVKEPSRETQKKDSPRLSQEFVTSSKQPSSTPSSTIVSSPSTPTVKTISIEKLKKILPNINRGKFKIRAKFKQVVEKLKTQSKRFYLGVSVKDDSESLTLDVNSDFLAKQTGVTPEKIEELRELVLKKNDAARTEIREALQKIADWCKSLDNVLEIQVTRGERFPVLINILDKV